MIIYNIEKNFISKKFKQYTVNIGTTIKSILVKVYNLISIVKHYHSPLWYIYYIITSKILGIDKNIILQMAFKVINDFTGLDGLIPTLLVFGVYS